MRTPVARPLLALLRHYDPTNPDPQASIDAAAAALDGLAPADLNDGQYAALVDRTIVMGLASLQASRLWALVQGGNYTLPVYEFQKYGARGVDELTIWLAGNDL